MNARLLALLTSMLALTACGVDSALVDDGSVDVDASAESMDELTTSRGRFETFTGRDGQTYFHLLAGNGEKVLASEGYTSASAAAAGIDSVQANGTAAGAYEVREARDGSSYFVLKARNGAVLGVSELYATKANAERAINAVVKVVTATTVEAPAPRTEGRFEVFRGLDGKSYFHLRAKNGEIVLQSQGYASRASATAGVQSVQTNGLVAARYAVLPAVDGRFYFVLKATNGQTIARGQLYASKANAERGVETVMALVRPVEGSR
ncbi:MAG: YegP family protein [Myxococcaceae bacterium]|nr:YegP family protein [Myxococcaceae bacterium]